MPKFRLRPEHPDVDLFQPAGGFDSIPVKSGDVIEAPGVLVTSGAGLPADAYVVDNAGEQRAWPHAVWELVEDKPAAPAKVKES